MLAIKYVPQMLCILSLSYRTPTRHYVSYYSFIIFKYISYKNDGGKKLNKSVLVYNHQIFHIRKFCSSLKRRITQKHYMQNKLRGYI